MIKKFMDNDFLLQNETSKNLFHSFARKLPIIDYHCHINPKDIAENKKFDNITQIWLYGDHYKWRAMRSCGVDEKFITGQANDFDKFKAYAEIMPQLAGNPLYHWTHLELQRYFGITKILNAQNAKEIYDECERKLKSMSVQNIINNSDVELICTTDDPDDDLAYHKQLAEMDFNCKVITAFRPDRLLKNADADALKHLEKRLDYFVLNGCKLSDHGVESFQGDNLLLLEIAGLYKERGIIMQIHYGVQRNINSSAFRNLGPDTGFDTIGDKANADGLMRFLDRLESEDKLPKTILYSLNPNENAILDSIAGSFRNVYHGSAWWLNDTKNRI